MTKPQREKCKCWCHHLDDNDALEQDRLHIESCAPSSHSQQEKCIQCQNPMLKGIHTCGIEAPHSEAWENKIDWKKQVAGSMTTVYINNHDAEVLKGSTKILIDFLERRINYLLHQTHEETVREMEGVWKPVMGYEGLYEVSNLGKVRSLTHKTLGRWGKLKTNNGTQLKGELGKLGYVRVDLCKNGKCRKFLVHRLVLKSFSHYVGICVNHVDGNKSNNRLENLEWVTHKENTQDGIRRGTIKFPNYKQERGIKKFCINGHQFTGENTFITKHGFKGCRKCKHIQQKNYKQRQRLAQYKNSKGGI